MIQLINLCMALPNKNLYPNRSKGVHWAALNKFKKIEFSEGYYSTLNYIRYCTNNNINIDWIHKKNIKLELIIMAYFSTNRKRDQDNFLAALKSKIDGIFNALNIDDSAIKRTIIEEFQINRLKPHVQFIIRENIPWI